MTEVFAAPSSPSQLSQLADDSADPAGSLSPNNPAHTREWMPNYAQNRMSQYSQQSQQSQRSQVSQGSHHTLQSRPPSNAYPAFASSLPYALVRDFAYPAFHPMHYGAETDPSGQSTPISDWNPARRQSDPMEQLNSGSGWSAGPWGGDGAMGDDGESLPSTSFGGGEQSSESEDDSGLRRSSRPHKSKSYTTLADFERGRRRDSEGPPYFYTGQQTDPAGRDSLRLSRGHGGTGPDASGPRRISPYPSSTLPRSSFGHPQQHPRGEIDADAAIPLDAEPHTGAPALRESLGPEDEDLFAGLSLALYSFEPENRNELRLVEGQEILVSYRHGQGWLVASDPRTGEQGLVPEAYVRLIADIPGYDPETGQFVDLEGEDFDAHDDTSGVVAVDEESASLPLPSTTPPLVEDPETLPDASPRPDAPAATHADTARVEE